MEERRVADYFVVAGLPSDPGKLDPLEEYSDEAILKPNHKQDPIVDVAVINKSLGELPPVDYKCVETTPTGFPADLNHGSIRAPEVYLCYRRGRDKPPLTDIGVLYEGKERIMSGCEVVYQTPQGRPANVNNSSSSSRIFITHRRAEETAASDTLAVMDICVILVNKGETPPHAFCQINKTLNKGMMGSDVYLCYKKSMAKANLLAFKPCLLGRYPLEDLPNFPLPLTVPMFCLPLGATLESWPTTALHPLPVYSTFVLTGAAGEKVYGAAVTFYERYDSWAHLDEAQQEQLGLTSDPGTDPADPDEAPPPRTVQQNKSICLLSRSPFFTPFKKFLIYLYKLSVSGIHPVPIERHISHFLTEVPYPSPQRPRILVQLNNEAISVSQPEESPLPQSGASFVTLLKNLGPENCLILLLHTLLESKILIHSLRPAVLTSIAESVTNMIFPFHWQCAYIPLCPLGLSDMLNAPMPFVVGVDSRYFDLYEPPPDVTCVDLDTNTISPSEDRKAIIVKLLPKRPAKVLRATLERLFEQLCDEAANPDVPIGLEPGMEAAALDLDFTRRKAQLLMDTAIQEAFLRFSGSILKGYENYLSPITTPPTLATTNLSSLFDIHAFLKSRDKAYHKFFTQLMKTQLFSRFIEERSFVSDKDASLAFFDECTHKVDENKDEPKLIELEDNSNSERTVFIMPPEPVGLPSGATYSYTSFPPLNSEFFRQKPKPAALSNLKAAACPSSPMTRRTKQEIRSAQKIALKQASTPVLWAKCLLSHCYSLWFIHLPAFVRSTHSKTKALRTAYDVLIKMQGAKLQPPDEVCYRVLMQLCGLYHQPALAVKVFVEMKRSGVQPNAITYGFYNKAVLESKWPSSETNAYLLWTKLRNVIMAMAQFRKPLKEGRRCSIYSNSDTDFDQISRTSTDSYLEDVTPIDKTDSAKAEQNHVHVESPNNEEKTSTGGMSDRGYNSMTLEDAKRISIVIGSQDSIESLEKHRTIVKSHDPGSHPQEGETKSVRRALMKIRPSRTVRVPEVEPLDPQVDQTFQKKVGSIVKKPTNGSGANGALRGSTCSSAGLLMTSQSSLDDSVFNDINLTRSLNLKSFRSSSQDEGQGQGRGGGSRRQRHSSAGDFDHKERTPIVKEIRLHSGSGDGAAPQGAAPSDPQGQTKSSVHFKDEEPENKDSSVDGSVDVSSAQERTSVVLDDVRDRTNSCPPEVGGPSSSDQNSVAAPQTSTPLPVPTTNGSSPEKPQTLPNLCTDISSPAKTSQSPTTPDTPSKSMSPVHSVRTPVTENDPLGVFNPDQQPVSSSPPPKALVTKSSSAELLLDLEPFSGSSASRRTNKVDSFSSSEASSPGSPIRAWSPLAASSSTETPGKASTLPAQSKLNATPGKSGKLVSRSESFGTALRSAASVFASRLQDFKQSMSTPGKGSTGSLSSTSREDLDRDVPAALKEEEVEGESVASNDPVNAHGSLDNLTVDGTSRSRTRLQGRYTPFVSGLLGGFRSLQHSSYIQGLQQGWSSVKESMNNSLKYSLAETWGLSVADLEQIMSEGQEAEAEAEYQNSRRNGDDGDSTSQSSQRSAPPHSVLEQYTGSDETDRSSLKQSSERGSVLSLPQTFFNMAMEVEMCSLSRCQSCSSLLYDEEIMAGWSADDSNLNTTCQFCETKLVPFLQICIKDFRQFSRPLWITPSQSMESMQSLQSLSLSQPRHGGANTSVNPDAHSLTSLPENGSKEEKEEGAQEVASDCPTADSLGESESEKASNRDSVTTMTDSDNTAAGSKPDRDSVRTITDEDNCVQLPDLASNGESSTDVLIDTGESETADKDSSDVVLDQKTENSLEKSSTVETESCAVNGQTETETETVESGSDEGSKVTEPSQPTASSAVTNGGTLNKATSDAQLDTISQTSSALDDTTDQGKKSIVLEPMSVPYLSPLVLRKEMENVMEHEGDLCLVRPQFADEHPIIFWNLVWYFKRLDVTSHLPGLILLANSTNKADQVVPKCWSAADSRHVAVRTVWDNLRMHEEVGPPMYTIWSQAPHESTTVNALVTENQIFTKGMMQHIVSSIMCNDVVNPIKMVMNERRKQKKKLGKGRLRSMYRDILFLSFVALGRDNIDHDSFDREYKRAFNDLPARDTKSVRASDRPPNMRVLWCRRLFGDLEL